jgi:hypothetical protein
MKATIFVTLTALSASVLARFTGTCNEGEDYCGDYLVHHRGWSYGDLIDAIDRSGLPRVARNDPDNVLFKCTASTEIYGVDYCQEGCIETGPNGGNDFCRRDDVFRRPHW